MSEDAAARPDAKADDDIAAQRDELLAGWERVAAGWARRADRLRDVTMPVSAWMIERLDLRPGQRVLELAAGPGDVGFLAAELVSPGGTVISSDAAEAMLELARTRANERKIGNVEFRRLELEWLDLPAASVDAILCRWGLMLCVDPAAAAHEARRVLRPAGRIAVAVWDGPERNPWATVPNRALIELGLMAPPDREAPGMFALAGGNRLAELLQSGGFVDVVLDAVAIERGYESLGKYIEETLDLSQAFANAYRGLDSAQREQALNQIGALAAPFTASNGGVRFPGRSLVAAASA